MNSEQISINVMKEDNFIALKFKGRRFAQWSECLPCTANGCYITQNNWLVGPIRIISNGCFPPRPFVPHYGNRKSFIYSSNRICSDSRDPQWWGDLRQVPFWLCLLFVFRYTTITPVQFRIWGVRILTTTPKSSVVHAYVMPFLPWDSFYNQHIFNGFYSFYFLLWCTFMTIVSLIMVHFAYYCSNLSSISISPI